jgi:hypothetical protein
VAEGQPNVAAGEADVNRAATGSGRPDSKLRADGSGPPAGACSADAAKGFTAGAGIGPLSPDRAQLGGKESRRSSSEKENTSFLAMVYN